MITALAIMIAVAGYLNFTGNKIGEEDIAVSATSVENTTDVVADGGNLTEEEQANADVLGMDISDEDAEQAAADGFTELTDIESLDTDIVQESADLLPEDVDVADGSDSIDTDAALGTDVASATGESDGTISDTPGEAVFTSSNRIGSLSNAKLVKEQTRAKNKETLLEVINNANIESGQKQDAIDHMIQLTDIAEKEMSAEILLEAKGFSDAVVSISDGYADVCVSTGELSDAQRAQIEDIVKRKTGIPAENIIITPI